MQFVLDPAAMAVTVTAPAPAQLLLCQQQLKAAHLDDAAKVQLLYELNNHFVPNPWLAGKAKRSRGTQPEYERSVSLADAALQQQLGAQAVTVYSQLPTAAGDVLDMGLLLAGSSSGFQPYVLLAPHGSKDANGALRKQPKKADQHRQGQAAIEYGSFNSINPTHRPKPVQAQGFAAGIAPSIIRNLSTCRVVFASTHESTAHAAAPAGGVGGEGTSSGGSGGGSSSNSSAPGVLTRVNRVFVVVSDLPEDIKQELQQQQQQQQQQQRRGGFLPWVAQSVYVPGREGYVGAIALYEFMGQSEEQQLLGRQALGIHLSPPTSSHSAYLPSQSPPAAAAATAGGGSSNLEFVHNPEMHQILDMLASDSDIPEVLGDLSPPSGAAAAAAAAAGEAVGTLGYSAGLTVTPISDAQVQQDLMEDMQLQLPTEYIQQQQQQQQQQPDPVLWQQLQAQHIQQLQQLLQQLQLSPCSRQQKQLQVGALRGLMQVPQLQQQQIQQTVQHKVLQAPCQTPQWRRQVSSRLSTCSELLKVLLLSVCAGNHVRYSEQLWVLLLQQVELHNAAVAEAEIDGLPGADRYRIEDVLLLRNEVGRRTPLHMLVSDFAQMLLLPDGCQELRGPEGPLQVRSPQQLVQYLQANAAAATGVDLSLADLPGCSAAAAAVGAGAKLAQVIQLAAASAISSSGSSGGKLPAQERVGLLQLARAYALGTDGSGHARWQQVLRAPNKNGATAWLTACHWCIPEVVEFFLSDPDFDLHQDMLATTKKHRVFYHIISRELAERANLGQDTARHLQALHTTLAALADKVLQEKCWAAGPAGTAARQLLQATRQQQQQQQEQGPADPAGVQSEVSLLPLKRRHVDSTWQQLYQPQQAVSDGRSAAGCSSTEPAVSAGVAGSSALSQWLQELQHLLLPHELLLGTMQDLRHKYLYRVDQEVFDAAALKDAVWVLFGFKISSPSL